MASSLDIPKTEQQAENAGKLLIQSVAVGVGQRLLYKAFIKNGKVDSEGNPTDVSKDPAIREAAVSDYSGQIPDTVTKDTTPYDYKSMLGTDVMSNLVIEASAYEDIEGFLGSSFEMRFDHVLLNVEMNKNIVMTELQGRNNDVKEYISNGSYAVSIKGSLTGAVLPSGASFKNNGIAGLNGAYPTDEMAEFVQMIKCPKSLKVRSWYLSQFGIDYIVVKRVITGQQSGQYSTQHFEIQAYSDEAIELTLI